MQAPSLIPGYHRRHEAALVLGGIVTLGLKRSSLSDQHDQPRPANKMKALKLDFFRRALVFQ